LLDLKLFFVFHILQAISCNPGLVVFQGFFGAALVMIDHRKMQKNWQSSPGRFTQIWL
jgi:hypothetical protein